MEDPRVTNWFLAGILLVMIAHLWMKLELPAAADTLRLDYCITEKMTETPQQYLHVIAHAPAQ